MTYWMLQNGKTSEEWYELPMSDVRLMMVFYRANLSRQYLMMKNAVMEGMSGGKKTKPI